MSPLERLRVLVLLWACVGTGLCNAAGCPSETYFAPHDLDNRTPLKAPHPEFEKTRKAAARGDPAEARNLAALYESGYLVSPCSKTAQYWYSKAAEQGDSKAKAWIDRHAAMERVRAQGECFGDSCFASSTGQAQQTVLRADARGSYSAPVIINGKTVRGIVDTGATLVAIGAKTANELGIAHSTGRRLRVQTANGIVHARAVMLGAVTVGNITLNDVEGAVSESEHPLLIGMSFLKRLTINSGAGGMTLVKH
jgi:clan AA aspartic protease (TIGR02281 family)